MRGIIHVHSTYSHDGKDTLEQLVAFGERRGFQFIALTDHAEDVNAARFAELVAHAHAVSTRQVRIIPGLEFRFRGLPGLHLLACGLSEWSAPKTPAEFLDTAGAAAQLTVVAHPVLARHRIPAEVLSRIDAIEVWNGAYNTRFLPDPRSVRMLHRVQRVRPEVVGTIGPDMHDCRNFRDTELDVPALSDDPLDEVREGRFRNVGRTMSFSPTVPWGMLRLGALTIARDALDRTNWVHNQIVRARREWARAKDRPTKG